MFKSLKAKLQSWVSKAQKDDKSAVNVKIEEKKKQKNNNKLKKKEAKVDKIEKSVKKVKDKEENKKEKKELKEIPKKVSIFSKSLSEERFDELFEELELILLQNNVAYEVIDDIKKSLKENLVNGDKNVDILSELKKSIENILFEPEDLIEQIKNKKDKPFVILFAGINGAGKTTTIAKVANLILKNKFSVCFAAADTFRAASIEQLQFHADKLNVPLIKKDYGADPASVGFDAIKYAQKNKIDVVLIDTAGRMNNKDSLMKEIEKIARVNNPDLKIFLGESITGNDATQQAKDFNDAIGIDGIILSKADVDEKGGTAISVSKVTGKPIYYLGTGQNYDDIEKFDSSKLINLLFD